MWQLDFSEYETTTGGVWRLAGVTDYFTKYEHGWHIAPTCTGTDAIAAVQIAIGEAERLAGRPLREALPAEPETGQIRRIKLVTDIQYGCRPLLPRFVRPALPGSEGTGAHPLPLLHRPERVLLAC